MSEQSDEALVELRGAIMQFAPPLAGLPLHAASEVRLEWTDRVVSAILPIITAREAAAEAKGKREGIEEAAKVADASPYNNGLNDAPSAIATAIRARLGKKP